MKVDGCAPGCDYYVTGYHAKRGGKVLCGMDNIRYQIYQDRLDGRWYVRVVRFGQSEVLNRKGYVTWRRAAQRAQHHWSTSKLLGTIT